MPVQETNVIQHALAYFIEWRGGLFNSKAGLEPRKLVPRLVLWVNKQHPLLLVSSCWKAGSCSLMSARTSSGLCSFPCVIAPAPFLSESSSDSILVHLQNEIPRHFVSVAQDFNECRLNCRFVSGSVRLVGSHGCRSIFYTSLNRHWSGASYVPSSVL